MRTIFKRPTTPTDPMHALCARAIAAMMPLERNKS
jgi:hypothetical protein